MPCVTLSSCFLSLYFLLVGDVLATGDFPIPLPEVSTSCNFKFRQESRFSIRKGEPFIFISPRQPRATRTQQTVSCHAKHSLSQFGNSSITQFRDTVGAHPPPTSSSRRRHTPSSLCLRPAFLTYSSAAFASVLALVRSRVNTPAHPLFSRRARRQSWA
mgnify:CR=1 FL=1